LGAIVLATASCGSRTGLEVGRAGIGGVGGTGATSSSTGTAGEQAGCGKCAAATTCADHGLDCSPVGDGCGCLLDCGSCTTQNQLCGGANVANVCGTACLPTSCLELNYDCGFTGDGCVGQLNCSVCAGGQYCGGGGPNTCGQGACKTCAQQGFDCGTMDDDCGNPIQCGTCPAGTVCGGGSPGKPGVCGAPACVPQSCKDQGFDCGTATDTCGGIIMCGTCAGNQICGEKAPNACGASGACTNLCLQQTACPNGGTTTITGTVFAPQGTDPLDGVLVYVPNAPVQPFQQGVTCGNCSAQVTGAPLVSAVTGVDGKFTINNMPAGANIPLVIQNGRWRRQFVIPNVPACTQTALPTASMPQIRMPQTKAEGDIPLMAFVTGFADTLECVLRKIGIADSEFSDPTGNGRVRFYQGDGNPGVLKSPTTPGEDQLWGTQSVLNQYDMVYFACQGAQYDQSATAQQNLINYANAGGRIFATHYSYVWFYDAAPFSSTAMWDVDQMPTFASDPGTGLINTGFPEGLALAQWLNGILPGSAFGQIPLSTLRHDFDGVIPPSNLWLTVNDANFSAPVPMHYTFETPVGAPSDQQCGRVLYSDFHVEDAMVTAGTLFPTECSNGPMTAQEKMLEFMIFDLGACVSLQTCKNSQTCAQQNLQCGPAGDGCGNLLQCGSCAMGQLCVKGQCTDACTPQTCGQQGFTCGGQSDGCSGALTCGPCPSNQVCRGGNCVPGDCAPKTCADQGFICGPQGDTCGNLIQCGTCPANAECIKGQCVTPMCTPKTCSDLGYDCGLASDGCNGTVDCGSCTPPTICGGGGANAKPNVCGN
jgi:hypothetical protein